MCQQTCDTHVSLQNMLRQPTSPDLMQVHPVLSFGLALATIEIHRSCNVFGRSPTNTSHNLMQIQAVLAASLALTKTGIHMTRNAFGRSSKNTSHNSMQVQAVLAASLALAKTEN